MRINWKLRFQNKATLLSLIGVLVVAVYQLAHLFGIEIPIDQKEVLELAQNIIIILSIIGIVVDPTTDGIGDSQIALEYDEPRKDK